MADGEMEARTESRARGRDGPPPEAGGPIMYAPPAPESARYLEHDGEQLYVVVHPPSSPLVARVLLCGPFGLERDFSYTTWVRWARYLAGEGFEVLHFDYRGIGESSGRLERLGTEAWLADTRLALRFLHRRTGPAPVLVHGLRFGALLASRVFAEGEADGLLLWDAPSSARDVLLDVLRRKLAEDFVNGATKRRSRESFIAELERGGHVEVEGYLWGQRLWEESASLPLALPAPEDARPWLVVHLDRRGERRVDARDHALVLPIPRPPFWGADPFLLTDLQDVFSASTGFLREAARTGREAA